MSETSSSRRRRLPPLHHLRAFEAAARHGSITRAADELHVTQSAVSHLVKALEAHLDVKLVARQGRTIVLTEAGQVYYPELEAALDRMARATERIVERAVRPMLSVNVTSSFATRWLIPRLASFCASRPQIEVRLATTERMLDFNPHRFDVSIRCIDKTALPTLRQRRDWHSVDALPFLAETKFPVCSPALLRERPLRVPADMRRHTLLHARSSPEAWCEWRAAADACGVEAVGGLTFDNLHFALQAASRGLGLAMGSRPLAQEALDDGTLVAPFPGIESSPKQYHIIRATGTSQRPEVAAFCAWLQSVAG